MYIFFQFTSHWYLCYILYFFLHDLMLRWILAIQKPLDFLICDLVLSLVHRYTPNLKHFCGIKPLVQITP